MQPSRGTYACGVWCVVCVCCMRVYKFLQYVNLHAVAVVVAVVGTDMV